MNDHLEILVAMLMAFPVIGLAIKRGFAPTTVNRDTLKSPQAHLGRCVDEIAAGSGCHTEPAAPSGER